ncbi:MAG: pentapeptide repeat-containing protein [Acetobacter sp.]|jgi:uncharacterized protein YjbI with pentapeptide repeats|nr:pentapeptide repeat-containing protein [Acetobacter sp.]MCH4060303.1 pentapeptide repeat-containing protein [Acetobacter sp.]MCH4087243.1 pentapeptide repeat-containing protein [Acetobacter sp.]MCI1293064.1 pentapeptide repeat-containing protein [Acetobacter sp.]MCI1319650.1 pentapeptide repeat-containing protein [Acetobacter sp.]
MTQDSTLDHYGFLLECLEKQDIDAWNAFVSSTDDIIKLRECSFDNLSLNGLIFQNRNGRGGDFYKSTFKKSNIQNVDFSRCSLLEASLDQANISGCIFTHTQLIESSCVQATIHASDFSCAKFIAANVSKTDFLASSFYESDFQNSNLEGTRFLSNGYNILNKKNDPIVVCGANFRNAHFDGNTYFDSCVFSRKTDFRSPTFPKITFYNLMQDTAAYCNRRKNWIDWYGNNNFIIALIARFFWIHSDYGRSPKRVIMSYILVSTIFSLIYYTNQSMNEHISLVSSFYFSTVTMTTLGYGDIHPRHTDSICEILVIIQVIYGYILIGALISIVSALFTSTGPAIGLIKHPKKKISELKISDFIS